MADRADAMRDSVPEPQTSTPPTDRWPVHDGETARLIAGFDWASTGLGPIPTWTAMLRSTVALILRSHVPMVTLWGEEGVMIYNDAYSVFAGARHPNLLGLPVREGWHEVAEFNDHVMKVGLAGGTLSYRDQELTLHRNGRAEQVWMNLDYSPLIDERGVPIGVIAIVVETTEKMAAEQAVRSSEARHRQILDSATDYAIIATDLEGRVTRWNEGARQVLAWTEGEMLGRGLEDTFTREDRDAGRVAQERRTAIEHGGSRGDHWHVRKSGELFWASGAMTPVRDEVGTVNGFVKVLRDRTEDHLQEQALVERAAQLRRAQEAGGVGIFSVDLTEDVIHGTPEFFRIFGIDTLHPIPAAQVEALVVRDDAQVRSDAQRRSAGTAELDVEYRIRRADTGEERTIARRAEYERDGCGQPVRMVGVVQDVTERRRVQQALERSEQQFRALAQAIPNQVWTARPDGRLDWFNEQVLAYSGLTLAHLEGDGWTQMVLAEDLDLAARRWLASLESGETYEMQFRLRRFDGEFRWHLARAVPTRGEHGEIRQWVGTNTDIHAQKMSETATARDRDRMWAMSPDLMLVCDFDGLITAINPSSQRMLGWREDEMVGHTLLEFIHPDDIEVSAREVARLAQGASSRAFENRYLHKDGSYRLLDWTAVPDAQRIHGVGRDITDERASIRDQERIWTLSPVLKVVVAADGTLSRANPAWTQVLAWTDADTDGRPLIDFVAEGDKDAARAAFARSESGLVSAEQQFAFLSKGGGSRQIVWRLVRENGVLYGFGRDVTEQRAAEEALRQSQKMEAVGQLTGGIAHDFNNLLQGITGSLDLVQKRIEQGRHDELDRFVRGAIGSARRAAALTHRLLAFARRQPLDPRPVRANPLIASMEDMLRRTLGERVQLELVLAGGLWTTLCDANQLESALLNLAINARDAMPGGGRLIIETCNSHLDMAYAAQQRDVRPGQYVCIAVTDTGTGMSSETMSKAFEPFFTTKPIGKGTGLGLSMIYGFARQSEGSAKLYSELGKGTTFKLYLPRHRGQAGVDELPEAPPAETAHTGETVLVVEDEEVVRGLVVEVLKELGYRTLEAADGLQGLEVLQSDQRIDLLITDIGLPGLNGRQIAEAGRRKRDGLKVLFMTGYAENAAVASGFLEPGMAMITKPFAMEALATRIREISSRSSR